MGEWVEIRPGKQRFCKTKEEAERLRYALAHAEAFHHVIDDEMEPTKHPCTGEVITSKRRFREITRAHGCIEYGNEDISKPRKPPEVDEYKVGKMIYDMMEVHGVDYKQLREGTMETLRHLERVKNEQR